jgi:hypothetical protein
MAFDPDEYLNETGSPSAATTEFDPDAYLSKLDSEKETEFDPDVYLEEPSPVTGLRIPEAPSVVERPVEKTEEGFIRKAADVPVRFLGGTAGVLKSVADVFGADSPASQDFAERQRFFQNLVSESGKEKDKRAAEIIKSTEDAGLWERAKSAGKAFLESPSSLLATGAGSLAPFIATAGAGSVARLGAAGIQGLQVAAGALTGAGAVKGEIYDAVKQAAVDSGKSEEEADALASEAQSYGENPEQILAGGAIGALAAATGIEATAGRAISGAARKLATGAQIVGKNVAQEVVTEVPQEAQVALAKNFALQKAGFDVPTLQGVVEAGTTAGIVAAALGGAAGGIDAVAAASENAQKVKLAVNTQSAAQEVNDIAPLTASVVSDQAEVVGREGAEDLQAESDQKITEITQETPDQRVARLQAEATAAAGIELEEGAPVSGLPPVEPIPTVTPTLEAAVAPVEPVVEPVVAEPQPVAIVPAEPVVTPKEPLPEDKSVTILNYDERVKPIQDQIDAKLDELEAGGTTFEEADQDPSVRALYEQRYAMDRGAINSYRDIVNNAFSDQGITNDNLGFTPASSISEKVYGAPRKSDEGFISRVYETGQNAFNNDQATIKKLSEDIFKYRAENEGLDPAELLGPRSGLTDAGKKARVDEARIAAETIHNQIKNSLLEQSQAQPEALALPPAAVTPPAEVAPTPEVVTPTPNLEPLRRVARAEQTEEDVSGLVGQGLVELYNGQPVITQGGLEALPEAERPRLTPEARKIQIDTGSNEVVAEAIAKNLRIGVDQVGPNVTLPTGWTLEGEIYVPPAPQVVPEEAVVPTVEPITPEKQVVPEQQELVIPVARVEQEQVNQGKPDVAKIINQFTVLERAAVAGKLLEEGYIDGRTADKFVKEATSEKTGGFSMQQIGDAQTSADEKFNQQIAAARTSQPVAGEVSPAEVDLAAEDAARSVKERVSPTLALKPKTIIGKTAREALSYLSGLNLVESRDWDSEGETARWRKDPNVPKPFYAQIQDAAAILSKLPVKILDADKIVSNAEKGFKGGAKRFFDGDIGIPLTETARIQTATGAFVRRSVDKPLNVATLVHEVGHTLTADAVNKYITSKNPKGSGYLKVLDSAEKSKSTPKPVKDLITLYKSTINQLGLEAQYFGANGLAGGRARDSQRKAYDNKIANKITGNPFTWGQYYGLANIDEFVAQAWSDKSFQDLLKQLKAPDQQSLWTRFTRIIRDLFGFKSDSMASAVIDVSMQVAELEAPTGATRGVAFSGVPITERIARGEMPEPPTRNIWQAPEQEFTSEATSINEKKLPAVFNRVKEWKGGTINADIGGGRYNNATNWLRDRGVENLVIDWFNRDRATNESNISRVRGGQADTATVSNVLNVIQETEARDLVISQAADAIKPDGAAYFYIYEGKGDNVGRQTTKGWQENRKTQSYIDEISQHFENVERRNQMIVATGPIKEIGFAEAEPEGPTKIPTFSETSPEASTLSTMAASMAKVDTASEAKPNPENKPTYKISEIASVWMDQGGDARQLQDMVVEYTNLTPANAQKVANAIAKQYDIQQSIATAFLETQTGLSVEALPEGVTLPKEVDPDRPKPVMQRLFDVFMGVRVKPVKITGDEKALLKSQIRLKAAANRAAKQEQQRTADEVVEIIKSMELRGPVRPKQAQALAKRAAKVIWTSEKSMENFVEYAAKVVENANYDADLREAKDAQKRAKQLSTQKKVAMSPQREVLEDVSKIPVNKLDDPRMFAEAVNYYLRGFKSVLSPDYVVIPDAEMESYLSGAQSETQRNQRDLDREANERLAKKYGIEPDQVDQMMESIDIIKQIEAQENRDALENLLTEKAVETQQGLRGYDTDNLRADQRSIVSSMLKVDPKALDPEERQRFIRITNNIIYNNQTNGAEYFVAVAKGQQSAREAAQDSTMVAKNRAWINLLPRFISERMQRGWALELQSIADTFRNAFGKGAMAKMYDAMGMLDLNLGFTKANNTIDQIQEKISEFHSNLEKKYKAAARNQDGLLAEGVVGFLIQSVPKKDEVASINQRRDLIRQDIANRRKSTTEPERGAMADRIETILNQINGESVEAILNNMKREFPANHESLIWYKDTLLPQYKDFLKSFDENFNDQANNYENPNYLTIGFTSAGPSLAITPEEQSLFYDQVSLRPKQSAYTIKRVDYTEIPKDRTTGKPKEIEFNLRRNVFNGLSDQINKAYTSSGWQRIASFMKTPEAEEVFGGAANKDFFIERLNRLRLSRMRRGSMGSGGAIEKAVDSLSVISRKLGTGIALGGIYQWIKQPPDQLITAWGSGGRGDLLAKNIAPSTQKLARELLNKFSIGRRGDASAGYKYINQMEGHQNRLERYFSESKWDQAKEQAGKIADVWMIALKSSDFLAASAAWMTYYEGELNKQDIKIDDWSKEAGLIESDPKRRQAASFAEQMTDIYQGSSDPTSMATFAQSGKTGWENFVKAIFVPFNSFAIQQRMRLYSDARDAINGSKGGAGGLAGTIGGLILFHATKRYVIPAISGVGIGVLYGLMGVDMDEPDEEKQKEEANKNWRQFLADITGNLLVGGTPQLVESQFIDAMNRASYLVSLQLENDSILNDDGEIMSYDQYSKERSPFYRYKSYDNAMSLGMFDIGMGQAEQVALQTKMLATPEEMEMYTPEEQRLLYFSALSEWLYMMRLNDADFARLVGKARRDMIKAAKDREKELQRIRSGR